MRRGQRFRQVGSDPILPFAIAAIFAVVHLAGFRLTALSGTPRSIWLSVAGGVSVAYVFVHLLPELPEYQEAIGAAAEGGGVFAELERHVYLMALLGLATFYGLERFVCGAKAHDGGGGRGDAPAPGVFWIHLGSFAIYNCLIGYLLVHREEEGAGSLLMYAVAMTLHFIVNDHALHERHGAGYQRWGRWLLAAAPLAGLVVGLATKLHPVAVGALFAILGGGVVLNVLKEELPENRESRFWAFALGATLYSALLLLA